MTTCDKCDFIIHSDLHLKKHMYVRHGVKGKMLWVGDSINLNADFSDISSRSGMEVKSVEAYGISKEAAVASGSRFLR